MRHIFTTLLLAFCAIALNAQNLETRKITYARKGQNVTLDLHWTASNYGDIQWQQSTDNGTTWTDIAGATKPVYTYSAAGDRLLRVKVEGDPACPPIVMERDVRVVNLSAEVQAVYADGADVEVTIDGLPLEAGAEVEYGYCYALSALSRTYTMMPRHALGTTLPSGNFEMHCSGLRPGQSYNVRAYVKLYDGTIIYGPGKLVKTNPGIEWHSEDWTIEKTAFSGRFKCPDGARHITFSVGETPDNMKTYDWSLMADGTYWTGNIAGLKPGTTYHLKVTADVDGEDMEITKTIRTLTDYSTYPVDPTVVPVNHKIDWGERTLHRISLPDNTYQVEYPRLVRAADGSLVLTYHGGTSDHWQNCYIRRSYDNGETWTDQQTIYSVGGNFYGSGYYRICNPQVTLLDNGWLILSVCANANPETNKNCKVLTCISKDNGVTWSDPVIVCRGRTWEPHILQLPGGELELYVSSEAPWWGNGGNIEQEIIYARSTDYGQTWTSTKRCAYLPGARDGMPVPILMQGNKGVLFSIESVNSGLAPSLLHRDLDGEWDDTPWNRQNTEKRWLTNLNNSAGAPYCIQIPTGEIVVMAHTNQAGSVWQTCRPQVTIADNTGHDFKFRTVPASSSGTLNTGEGAYYNSLFQKDDDTIWLLVTRSTYNGNTRVKSSIEYMEGKIVAQ